MEFVVTIIERKPSLAKRDDALIRDILELIFQLMIDIDEDIDNDWMRPREGFSGEEEDEESPTGSRTVNRVTRYDCEMQKWSSAPSMNLARRWAAGVVLDDTLYVVGK